MQRYAFRLRFLPMQRSTNRRRFPALFCSHADREVYRPIRRVQIQTVRAIFVALCDIQNVLVVCRTSPHCAAAVACAAPLNHIVTSGVRATSGDYCDRSENTSRRRRRRRPLTRDCCYATGISGACSLPPSRSSSSSSRTGRSPVNTPPL